MITWKQMRPDEEPTTEDVMKEAYHILAIKDIQETGLHAVAQAVTSDLARFFSGTTGILKIYPAIMRITEKSGEQDG